MIARLVQTALIAATLVAGLASASQAAEPRAAAGVVLVDGRDGHWDRRGPHRGSRYEDRRRHDRRADVCSPGQALRKASRLGIRGADLVRANRRAVVVEGFKRGRPITIRFGQDGGCPVLGLR